MPIKKSREEFIEDAVKIHGDKYNYSKVNYKNSSNKVIIFCKIHGEFLKAPQKHLSGQGCRICNGYIELNQNTFIDRAKKTHGVKYDYSKSIIISKNEKVLIECNSHAGFWQLPLNHINGQGCPECGKLARAMSQRLSNEDFIKSAIKKHGKKYDYSEINYTNSQSKVNIACPEHGKFYMKPNSHLNGQGCPKCGRQIATKKITLSFKDFLKRAAKIHLNKYEYLESSYHKLTSKMMIFCSEHGYFEQTPHSHISMKTGCPKCGKIKSAISNQKGWETVLEMFRLVHGERYKYDSNSYLDVSKKMRIFCFDHGEFQQKPYQHHGGSGCNKCAIIEVHEKQKIKFDQFLRKSIEMHGNKYDYNDSSFIDIFTPITITCFKHGDFSQIPRDHYRGSGCPKCQSSRGENLIRKILQELNINVEEQKSFDDLIHKNKLKCDFYIPKVNTVIEFNGLQHYEPISIFGGIEGLKQTQKRDLIKYEYLNSKGIQLIIIRYDNEDVENYLKMKLT
jgi:Zn finger protein HypA/HybF involved in hydrogenase expression